MPDVSENEFPKYFNLDGEKLHRNIINNVKFTGFIEHADGTKFWYLNGINHRIDGPAIEYPDGTKFWYIDNKQVTKLQCKLLHDLMKLKGLK